MPITLRNTRVVLISGQASFDHFGTRPGTRFALPWIKGDYGRVFGRLRAGQVEPDFALPWRERQTSSFWTAYCGGQPQSKIGASTAWNLMLPLRLVRTPSPVISIPGSAERIFYDVYGFPHGVVTAVTVQSPSRAQMSLDQWRDRTRTLRFEPLFSVEFPGHGTVQDVDLTRAIDMICERHRNDYYGATTSFIPSYAPLSLVSVIQGEGVDPSLPLSAQPDIQRALEAVTAWPTNWQHALLPDLASVLLPASRANSCAGDALYAAVRGRSLWRPALFTHRGAPATRRHSLSCLSHNLLAGAVQAESLRLFAAAYALQPTNRRVSIPIDLAGTVAQMIGRLWRGEATYRSSSIRRLLEDPHSKAEVNALLASFGEPPIS